MTFESLYIIIGVTGNVLVILYNVRWNTDKNTTSCFITNLALSDLVVCGITFPTLITDATRILMEKTDVSCELTISILCASISLSIVNLMMLTIDRYICIALPLKYPHIVTQRKVSIALVSVWITGFFNFLMIFFTSKPSDVPFICDVDQIAVSVGTFSFTCSTCCIPLNILVGTTLLAASNSVTNAFIYGIRDKKYRRSFKQIFARCYNLYG
ncbi:histamine H2 receptor-like [Xenia sp. Carnegie-2017]|uniref:histamine H2 receptor-like n=1 Tax=Xenia sp. Carnegie-2017 TaxID=2897299 RepID=UPI001F04ED45|nr:histamine H2 receptor-like [Xenia sp. Carnegie-2017]